MVEINTEAPEFTAKAYHEGRIKEVSLESYRGKWVVLFFYPADFTFVCPTELGELANRYDEIRNLGAEVLSVSVDTEFVHKAWHDNSETIKKIRFPMVADPARKICRDYGTLIEDEGLSLRATFIIDPDGVVKALEFHDNSIGRNIDEIIRKIKAADFIRQHPGVACPVNWKSGDKTLTPGVELIGKI